MTQGLINQRAIAARPEAPAVSDEILLNFERIVIGYLLTPGNASSAAEEKEILTGREFTLPAHEIIFNAAQKFAGQPDIQMRVLESLIGSQAPKALDALETSLAGYLADCTRAADCVDAPTMRYYAGRVQEAHAQRQGASLLTQFGRAFSSGDLEAASIAWEALGDLLQRSASDVLTTGRHRNVNLTPYLNGTHKPLKPGVGGERDDNQQMLYAELWHTLVAPNSAGKSWFALWHCITEIRKGNTVVYAHFEESSPAGTIARIRKLAPELTIEEIDERFKWLDCTTRWEPGEFAKALPDMFTLLVLDGINAACGTQGWIVDKPESVGAYRSLFVSPACKRGAAVLSLGHPVKNVERQHERHGFGATGWLDEVNGVGFRLVPSKKTPIGKGQLGHSTLFTVKDREGEVQRHALLDTGGKREGWYRLGSFKVDDSPSRVNTSAWLNIPIADDEEGVTGSDPVDKLAESILALLPKMGGRFEGVRAVQDALTASKVTFNKTNVAPAIQRLAAAGRLRLDTSNPRKRIDGVLVPLAGTDSPS